MLIGLILFVLFFIVLMPQSRTFLLASAAGVGAWLAEWAPFSYLLMLIVLAAPFAGVYLMRTWPQREEPENPMAKYRREMPIDED
jgi:hypothetical protein